MRYQTIHLIYFVRQFTKNPKPNQWLTLQNAGYNGKTGTPPAFNPISLCQLSIQGPLCGILAKGKDGANTAEFKGT
jgi:hypothetical protein